MICNTVWKEILAVGKFDEFAPSLVLAEENLANLPILKLKLVQQNPSVIFKRITDNMKL